MTPEELKKQQSESQQDNVPDNVDYIEAIKEMKQNTVDKGAYDKLKEDNQKLLKALIDGDKLESEVEDTRSIDDIRKELFDPDNQFTNLEYVTQSLELRDKLLAEGKPDPFLPYGSKIVPTNEDVEAANRVAKILKECVDYADGDPSIFTTELQRVMIDSSPVLSNKGRKK